MAENDINDIKQERLVEGQTTVTPSSNEAIAADLKALVRQYHGLLDPETTLEGDRLLVRPIAGTTIDTLTLPSPTQKQTELADLKPDNILRIMVERDQVIAASNAGVSRRLIPQLKQRLRAA